MAIQDKFAYIDSLLTEGDKAITELKSHESNVDQLIIEAQKSLDEMKTLIG